MRLILILLFLCTLIQACSQKPVPYYRDTYRRSHEITQNLFLREINDQTYVVDQITLPYQANGLLLKVGIKDWVLVDTPNRQEDGLALVEWFKYQLPEEKLTVITTHYREDSTGSTAVFLEAGFPVLQSKFTTTLLKEEARGHLVSPHTYKLQSDKRLKIGASFIHLYYPGPAFTPDNIMVYFPKQQILFGSGLIRLNKSLGDTKDADIRKWKIALERIAKYDLSIRYLIPGQGYNYSPGNFEKTQLLLREKLEQ